jgi:predicted Zn-dependent protease
MNLRWAMPIAMCILFAPATSKADAFRPGKGQQVKIGKSFAKQLRSKSKVLPSTDPRVQELRAVGSRLLSKVNYKNDPWEFSFDVIDSKEVNAFALPGGSVFFYTGLLNKLKTEDELAGVLGHEMTHVLREHWAYAYADSQKRSLILNLGLILGHVNGTLGNLAGLTETVVFDLPFSRKHETQADEGGLNMMSNAGYNPAGMVDVFTLLRDLNKGGEPPQWLSDHPDDKNRIKHMQEIIDGMHAQFPAQRNLPWY